MKLSVVGIPSILLHCRISIDCDFALFLYICFLDPVRSRVTVERRIEKELNMVNIVDQSHIIHLPC